MLATVWSSNYNAASLLIRTVAGTGEFGFFGEGETATTASLKVPQEIALDAKWRSNRRSNDALFVLDSLSERFFCLHIPWYGKLSRTLDTLTGFSVPLIPTTRPVLEAGIPARA